jgi:putative ABC transport system permease protein
VPLVFKPEQINHDFHWLLVMGRLKPGITIKQAQADMDNVTAHVAQAYPKSNHGWGAQVDPEKLEWVPKETQLILWLLLGAAGFVLLIACVNVANLLLGRSMSRQKEMAIRSSLGATPAMIFEQLLTENLLLAFLGGALGIALGYALLQGVLALMPRGTLPTEADLRINLPILGFAIALTTLTGLLFGCVPAWYDSRIDPAGPLKEGGRSGRKWTPPPAQGAGGERVCLGAYLARRGGISHSQLSQFAGCRSGHSHRPHSHLLSPGS